MTLKLDSLQTKDLKESSTNPPEECQNTRSMLEPEMRKSTCYALETLDPTSVFSVTQVNTQFLRNSQQHFHVLDNVGSSFCNEDDLHFLLGTSVCILTNPVIKCCHLSVYTGTIASRTSFTPAHNASKVPSISLSCAGQGTSRISLKQREFSH